MRDEQGRRPNGCPSPFGHDTNGHSTNGVARPGGPFTRVLGDTDEASVDLVAVQADDELVNALGARPGLPVGAHHARAGAEAGGGGTDDRLVAMLAAWRAEIDADPIPELVDLDAAVAAVAAGVRAQESAVRRRRAVRIRQLAPLAAAAAIIVATVTGVGLGSQNAMPGDTLWPIQKVVNPERAESVEAKAAVEGRLQKVRAALKEGDTVTAARELEAIRTEIPVVRDEEGQPMLVQEQQFLAAKLADTPPGTPADLSTPPKSNPAARPTGAAASSPASTTPSTGSAVTAPSGSASKDSTAPQSTEPDVRQRELDRARAPLAPSESGGSGSPALPQPSTPAPQVTSPPEATQPDGKPKPGAGDTEGGKDASTPPGPVQAPPAPETGGGSGAAGGGAGTTTTSDTTTASGSAGANLDATATHTTS